MLKRRKDLEPFDSKSLFRMVRLAGIEPTTPWFVAKYSIQLSYSRQASNYSAFNYPDNINLHQHFFVHPLLADLMQIKTVGRHAY